MKSVGEKDDPREELLRHKNAKEEFGVHGGVPEDSTNSDFVQVGEEEKAADDDDSES